LLTPSGYFEMRSIQDGAIFAAILAVLNAFVRPIVMLITCPIQILTLGLSALVINAVLFLLAANFVSGIHVGGFVGALIAAIVVSIVSWGVSIFVRA
jgi:putative membrane protein